MWGWGRKTKRQKVDDRHVRGMAIAEADVVVLGEDRWRVTSQSGGAPYTVSKVADQCPHLGACAAKCFFGCCRGLCLHMYSCTCPDEVAPCKHVHRVRSLSVRASVPGQQWQATVQGDEAMKRDLLFDASIPGQVRRSRDAMRDLDRFLDKDMDCLAGIMDHVVETLERLRFTCDDHADALGFNDEPSSEEASEEDDGGDDHDEGQG